MFQRTTPTTDSTSSPAKTAMRPQTDCAVVNAMTAATAITRYRLMLIASSGARKRQHSDTTSSTADGGYFLVELQCFETAPSLIEGQGVISKARESIGVGLAAGTFMGEYFGNGTQLGGVIEDPNNVAGSGNRNRWKTSRRWARRSRRSRRF